MPIPKEGLGEKRYRAGLVKQQAAVAEIAATAEKLDTALQKPDDPQVEVDAEFEAAFSALEAEEAVKAAAPIDIADPHNAAPTHARATIVNGQKVIDMGSIKITATPEKIEVQRHPAAPPEDSQERPAPVLSQKTLDEMAAGRAMLERHKSAATARSLQPERSEPGGVADGGTVPRSREAVWLAAGLTPEEITALKLNTTPVT